MTEETKMPDASIAEQKAPSAVNEEEVVVDEALHTDTERETEGWHTYEHQFDGQPHLVEVEGVDFAYPGHEDNQILFDVSFVVHPGELITLLGPNGAGKSTLLNCIMNLLTPQKGTIRLDGQLNTRMPRREIAQMVAYVQQTVDVTFAFTVRDYAVMGRTPYLKMYAAPGEEDYALVDDALDRLGVLRLKDRVYSELSGGQRQLVDVARAIVQKPRLILFDEPTSALDYGNQIKVLKMVKELSREDGFAAIMTTHNPDHPILLNSSVCLLGRDGRLRKGTVDEIMREDVLEDVYQAHLIIRDVPDAGRRVCMTPAFE